jgi:hypothetical protein
MDWEQPPQLLQVSPQESELATIFSLSSLVVSEISSFIA